jgi:GTP-binding protein HflX
VVLADTVGFISHLPHKLVDAFRATLEETASADLLLHVVDAATDERMDHIEQVEAVLRDIGAADVPRLEVFNKLDLLEQAPRIDRDEAGRPVRVWLSAQSGDGTELLFQCLAELVGGDRVEHVLNLAPDRGRLRAQLYSLGAVESENHSGDGYVQLHIRMDRRDWRQLLSAEKLNERELLLDDWPQQDPLDHHRVA